MVRFKFTHAPAEKRMFLIFHFADPIPIENAQLEICLGAWNFYSLTFTRLWYLAILAIFRIVDIQTK